MKIRSVIVDDELNCRDNLRMIINDYCPELEVVGIADSAQKARDLINHHNPDLVFLDIKMPKEDGFQLLKSYPEREFSVVFTTAYNEYALQAFKADAVDYIEKPIGLDELRNAVKKVIRLNPHLSIELSANIENADAKRTVFKDNEKISLATRDGFTVVKNDEIIHLEASDNYTMIYMSDSRKFLSCKNIKVYEDSLNPEVFYRVHKSHIINVKHHLKGFSRNDGNNVQLSNGKMIPVARRKLSDFMEIINKIG
ncbi:MAG TPA: LytTR family DNA-binding domain-containing protein [Flavobacteriales bacterium]|nr:LytTR family DNA-binding domain-containing protein [Flavobacteriales bacterium]